MRHGILKTLQQLFAGISLLLLFAMVAVVIRSLNIDAIQSSMEPSTEQLLLVEITPESEQPTRPEPTRPEPMQPVPTPTVKRPTRVALISGHAGFDSGAICTDANGDVWLTEADINASITEQVTLQLRAADIEVLSLREHDSQLYGLEASLLLSLHSDSCIDRSGYKAAHHKQSSIPAIEGRLLGCINRFYPNATQLVAHPETITHDMTNYYAFRQVHPRTPAAILEMGFLGGDQALLLENSQQVASGVAESIFCFLRGEGLLTD